jgi:hypothetical protein
MLKAEGRRGARKGRRGRTKAATKVATRLRPAMFHVLRATCDKVRFPREFEDFGGGRRLFHVLHATKMGYMAGAKAEILKC